MRIMMVNSTGNCGKSTISRELLYPRLNNPLIIEVETVNKGSKELKHLNVAQFVAGDDFADLYLKMFDNENIIVDVGASQLAPFFDQMRSFAGIEDFFDYFVVPSVPADKEMTDTFKTILFLRESEISDDKIKVIFNKVKGTVDQDFAVLLSAPFPFIRSLFIPDSSLFKDLGFMRKTIADIYNPDVNGYKEQILSAKDPAEKLLLVKMDLANRQAVSMKLHLDAVFEELTGIAPERKDLAEEKKPKAKIKTEIPVPVEVSGGEVEDEDF